MRSSSIDASQISTADARNLGSTFLSAITRYYSDPEHVRAFEEWWREKYQLSKEEAVIHE